MSMSLTITPGVVDRHLHRLSPNAADVEEISTWCLHHATQHFLIFTQWKCIICQEATPSALRIGLLYFVHDIMWKTRLRQYKAQAFLFVGHFSNELHLILESLLARTEISLDKDFISTCQYLITCWADMQVLPPSVLKMMKNTAGKHVAMEDGMSGGPHSYTLNRTMDVGGDADLIQLLRLHQTFHQLVNQTDSDRYSVKMEDATKSELSESRANEENLTTKSSKVEEIIASHSKLIEFIMNTFIPSQNHKVALLTRHQVQRHETAVTSEHFGGFSSSGGGWKKEVVTSQQQHVDVSNSARPLKRERDEEAIESVHTSSSSNTRASNNNLNQITGVLDFLFE